MDTDDPELPKQCFVVLLFLEMLLFITATDLVSVTAKESRTCQSVNWPFVISV